MSVSKQQNQWRQSLLSGTSSYNYGLESLFFQLSEVAAVPIP